jgi:eukaryotic translation initiation factor 2C
VNPGPLIEVAKGLLGRNNGGFRGGRGGPRGGRGGGDRGGRGAGRGGFGGPPAAAGDLQSLSQGDIQKLRRVLFGAKFKMTHRSPNKVFGFNGLTLKSAEELTFDKDDGSKQTVAAYFKAQYKITLRYPRLPCVVTGKKTYIPMELVTIEPFHSLPPLKLTPDQTAEIIKVSAKPPADRRDAIMAWRKRLSWETKDAVKAWGIEVKPDFTEVSARVLNPPQIAYAGGARGVVKPAGGAWNLRGKKFFKAGQPLKASTPSA